MEQIRSGNGGCTVEYEELDKRLSEEREYNEILRFALDMAYEGIVIVDKEGYITAISKAYMEFLGIDNINPIGRHVTEVIENSRMHIVVKTGKPEEAQFQKIKNRYMVASRIPIVIDGEIKGAVGKVLFRNVKELDFLYKKFSKFQKELEDYKEEILQQYSARYLFSDIIGNDKEILEAKKLARKAALTDSNVLLIGESGTGKEIFAHSIHRSSNRVYGRFVKVNCAAIPSDLLESELFGYERGAFTGAKKEGKMGKFELADGGTIFLDEIGEMPLHMQVKLLRVLQEREVEPVGSILPKNIDIRIIAATNQNLEAMVREKKFREDLYYRLNVVTIRIPPLRERKDDIPLLALFLVSKIARKLNKPACKISERALDHMKNCQWEGNVRQLENVIERALNIMEEGENVLLPKHLPREITGNKKEKDVLCLKDALDKAERNAIFSAMDACGGNKIRTAKLLGISRNTLYEKLNKHKIL
ncbi:sigma-54 interaction domain-containing protein [Papillibacter cinnamivorans]|uniref:Transcriptional regulator containing PAS, AAA-type ATPase, and DNA-binding Fis domains n=1 Tax=Papillibacter cinnamivorans DSM 12816 TaxID=1122930 RepID=A0A1W1ZK64_9FIRM|nr:sigma 54-interacting transcriptional regulator [Papillibacter cinnamivorans]SMC48796.1 Transcriptional regulator containing PAS, AAA-type ATPase, and DNA-binding Fis domains [Papillibacter cinnamivorans DSM 12816]